MIRHRRFTLALRNACSPCCTCQFIVGLVEGSPRVCLSSDAFLKTLLSAAMLPAVHAGSQCALSSVAGSQTTPHAPSFVCLLSSVVLCAGQQQQRCTVRLFITAHTCLATPKSALECTGVQVSVSPKLFLACPFYTADNDT